MKKIVLQVALILVAGATTFLITRNMGVNWSIAIVSITSISAGFLVFRNALQPPRSVGVLVFLVAITVVFAMLSIIFMTLLR
jgi:hypothetical protein